MRRPLLLAALTLALPASARAAAVTGGATLRRTVSVRAIALGESYAAIAGGVDSLSSNPAGAAGAARPELETTFASGVIDDSFGFLGYAHPTRIGVLSAAAAYYDAGKILLTFPGGAQETRVAQRDMVAQTGWATNLGAGFSAGVLGKFYRFELAQEARATGAAGDAGLQWATPLPGLRLGAAMQNMGPSLKFESESDPLPLTTRFGAAWTFNFRPKSEVEGSYSTGTRLTFLADGVKVRDEKMASSAGGEFVLDVDDSTSLALRGGWIFGRALDGASFGAGVREGRFTVDYALAAKRSLGNVHHVGLGIRF